MSGIVGKNLGRGSGIVTATPVGADTVSGASIVDDAIDSEHYADGSIDNAHIADDAIDSEHYADGSIDNAHIADDAIDSEHYADGSIDNAHIADNAIDSEHYADGSIDNAHIADDAIDSEHYVDGSVDDAHLATGISASKLTGSLPALTLAGAITGADQTVSAINLKDYGEITVAKGDTSGADIECDLNDGNSFSATISTDAVTFTFVNPTASDEFCGFSLVLVNGGSQTVNWPASVDWEGGSAPSLTSSGTDILYFFTIDGGTIYHGFASSLDSK